jgi:hypothetical protein
VTFKASPEVKNNGLEFNKWIAELMSLSQGVIPGNGVRSFGKYYKEINMEGPSETAATITKYGKGEIAATYLEMGKASMIRSAPVLRDFLAALVREIFKPEVTVTGSHNVDVTLNSKQGELILNLVNASGPHDNEKVMAFDEIPPVGPLQVTIQTPTRPKKVMLQPENIPLTYTYQDGLIQCSLPVLKIHEIIVVQ